MTEIHVARHTPAADPPAPPEPCRNCGTPLGDRFCPHCGQPAADGIVSLRRMAAEFVDDQFTLNSAVPRTLAGLFFRPGFLTREYVAGRIARYLRPFRIFLVSVVLFFLAVSWIVDGDMLWRSLTEQAGEIVDVDAAPAAEIEGWSNVNLAMDTTRVPTWLMPAARRLQAQEDRLNALTPREGLAVLVDGTLRAAARVSLLLVPVFAALLKLLHVRRRRLYAEHFVFALHFHSVAFLTLTAAVLVAHRVVWILAAGYMLLYLLAALRTAYAQPWRLAAAKWLALLIVYPLVLSIAVVVATVVAVVIV